MKLYKILIVNQLKKKKLSKRVERIFLPEIKAINNSDIPI